jgi:hypothetical protein
LRELAFLLAKMTEGVIISTKTPPVKSSAFDSPLGDGAVVVLSYFSPTNSNLLNYNGNVYNNSDFTNCLQIFGNNYLTKCKNIIKIDYVSTRKC